MKYTIFLIIILLEFISAGAQDVDLTQIWPAYWIKAHVGTEKDYAVFHFRKTFQLDTLPDKLIVNTSGDNRYQLFVNESLVTWGPARGDIRHWFFETTDIAPYLKKGKNVLAVSVQNYGAQLPDAQLTIQTAFILAANNKKYSFLNTNQTWKAIQNQAYSPNVVGRDQINGYYGGGSREIVNGNKYTWNWQKSDFNDDTWENADNIESGKGKNCIWAGRWKLLARSIPLERLTDERFLKARNPENLSIPDGFPTKASPFTIPANTKARFILDQGHETTAYPVIKTSKGQNATIKLTYSEAPYIGDPKNQEKGNRNDITGKTFFGYFDKFTADGSPDRIYKPLWWRAFRYVEVQIETKGDPLEILDMCNVFSTYPFDVKSAISLSGKKVQSDTSTFKKIVDNGIRTIRLCSHETFMDCPYYEESQFEGDTRVEALISYFTFGDGRLGKNAIDQFHWSVNDEGFLSARYPTNSLYYIPNFSLFWIGMVHDYMMYFNDSAFIHSKIQGIRYVLQYFIDRQRQDGTILRPDYHNFIDWSHKNGEPPFDANGYSALVDLHFLMALQWAAEIEQYAGDKKVAAQYLEKAHQLKNTIRNIYWNNNLGLFSDTPGSDKLSQHTNCLAIITDVTTDNEARQIMQKVLKATNMTPATLYWQFYLNEALLKSGMGNKYLKNLEIWKSLILQNVTTWPETGEKSRSECHGWGASPNYHLIKIVAGIDSDAPGFKKIRIEPNFCETDTINASIPHHSGKISVYLYKNENNVINGEIELPPSTSGYLKFNGEYLQLKEGKRVIKM